MNQTHRTTDRERQLRRTSSARRAVLTAGGIGALGAAVAVGATTQTAGAATGTEQQSPAAPASQSGTQDRSVPAQDRTRGQGQTSSGGLAAPGGSAPAQGRSGGS